ncbi:MAG: DUF4139 domain-containing protein [Deltaproteobacteria bacterium]|nr:DUF4139 domain-containing protein [Deltaproteobacteria bacterium]
MTTTLSSRIEAVTVYRMGALVRRRAELIPEQGELPGKVVLGGLPLCLDERSLRVRLEREQGPAPVATDLKVGLALHEPDPELPPADDTALRAARVEERKALDLLTLLRDELQRVLDLEVEGRPEPEEGKAPLPSPVEGRLSLLAFREREALRLHQELAAAAEALRVKREQRQELESQRAAASNARQNRAEELRKTVEVGLRPVEGSGSGAVHLTVEYLIPGAHWSPSYDLVLDPDLGGGRLAVRAAVRQRSGEDWRGVHLTLSTAEAQAWTELPELKAIRIGRRQAAPPRVGWRPPPSGAEALYADHDAVFRHAPPPPPPVQPAPVSGAGYGNQGAVGGMLEQAATRSMVADDYDDDVDYAMDDALPAAEPPEELWEEELAAGAAPDLEMALPPPAPMAPSPAGAPPPPVRARKTMAFGRGAPEAKKKARAPHKSDRGGGAFGGEDEGGLEARADLLEYGALRMRPPGDPGRGKLVPVSGAEITLQLVQALQLTVKVDAAGIIGRALDQARGVASLDLPGGHVWPHSQAGYDYAYEAAHPVDVPSDGAAHTLALMEAKGEAKARYVCVPRESQDVFRQVSFHNPLDAPLLDGPVDVAVGEDYLLTTRARNTPAKGELELGLGVEQAIKVARNVRFEEESKGLVLTKLGLEHAIEVELTSHLSTPVEVEVRERLPVAVENDDDVEVEELSVTPAWEDFEQEPPVKGGKRWRLTLPPAEKTVLRASYRINIPKSHELVGGNRREVS